MFYVCVCVCDFAVWLVRCFNECGKQVQIGSHAFTYDYVYGSTASPSTAIYDDCVAPLVDALVHGYNATVLAYGQVKLNKQFFFQFIYWMIFSINVLICFVYGIRRVPGKPIQWGLTIVEKEVILVLYQK